MPEGVTFTSFQSAKEYGNRLFGEEGRRSVIRKDGKVFTVTIIEEKGNVRTNSSPFYDHLTERERKYRQREGHTPTVSDIAALAASAGEYEISDKELGDLVAQTELDEGKPVHHTVWIGKWKLGMTWDGKLVAAEKTVNNLISIVIPTKNEENGSV